MAVTLQVRLRRRNQVWLSDTATVLAGAALAHQLRKHHKHDDISDIEDSYYDYERAAYEEEQAAYDDFIASNDMDND